MKKALIITCNDSYDYGTRTRYVEHVLKGRGYSVEHLLSDFDHRSKKTYKAPHQGIIHYLHVPAYSKNISVKRLLSHIRFGQQVRRFVMAGEYDLIYHCAPPNYTIKQLSKCKEYKGYKLITEVGDMWPESIPIGENLKQLLKIPFRIWSRLRDRYLNNSDVVIAECNLFRDTIVRNSRVDHILTLYFCKEYIGTDRSISFKPEKSVNLCYLGSINNIIDIDMIGKIIKGMSSRTSVIFHIIGDGENRAALIDTARIAGADVRFHGIVYDEEEKKQVFNQCHFALNIMKQEVFVGMTMKSLDYFSAGLPLINNIHGDIWDIVEHEKNGFNVSAINCNEIVEEIVSLSDMQYQHICESVKETHRKHFSVDSVEQAIASLI